MSFAPNRTPDVLGCFLHRETRASFEYAAAEPNEFEMPHRIFLHDDSTRYARVLKTVAYIVVDEDEHGAVIEKWPVYTYWRKT